MGCGSSSLKGDAPDGLGGESSQPIKKVQTNFQDVDYENTAKNRRMTEFAPHETEARPQSNASEGAAPDSSGGQAGQKLEPYHTIDEDPGTTKPSSSGAGNDRPQVNGINDNEGGNGPNPVSDSALQDFANQNDPANPINQTSHHTNAGHMTASDADPTALAAGEDDKAHKKSLYERFTDKRTGRDKAPPTDEELKKYTGMDRKEFEQWKEDPNSGVGENSSANPIISGSTGAQATYVA